MGKEKAKHFLYMLMFLEQIHVRLRGTKEGNSGIRMCVCKVLYVHVTKYHSETHRRIHTFLAEVVPEGSVTMQSHRPSISSLLAEALEFRYGPK